MTVAYCKICCDITDVYKDEDGDSYFCSECGSTIKPEDVEDDNELSG